MMRRIFFTLLLTTFLYGCDDTPPLSDTDLVTCDFDTMINNPVQGQSAQELIDECQVLTKYLGAQPTYKLLKETGIANSAFQIKGYKQSAAHTTERLLQIVEMRGQIHSGDDAIINNYNIVFKMYSAWDGEITPDTVWAFLSHYGPLSKKLSDDGFVGAMATVRLMK